MFFSSFKKKKINLLEIGIGGYKNPRLGGASLRMWKKYFSRGKIFGIDIYDKSELTLEQKQQYEKKLLDKILDKFMTEKEKNMFTNLINRQAVFIMNNPRQLIHNPLF